MNRPLPGEFERGGFVESMVSGTKVAGADAAQRLTAEATILHPIPLLTRIGCLLEFQLHLNWMFGSIPLESGNPGQARYGQHSISMVVLVDALR